MTKTDEKDEDDDMITTDNNLLALDATIVPTRLKFLQCAICFYNYHFGTNENSFCKNDINLRSSTFTRSS